MDILPEIMNRKSVRNFTDTPVNNEVIERILYAGSLAPTGCNIQSFFYKIIDDLETKKKIYKISGTINASTNQFKLQKFILKAPVLIGIICDSKQACKTWGHLLDYETEKERYLRASVRDASIASAFMNLQAEREGVQSVYMSSYEQDEILKAIKLSEDFYVLSFLCLGYGKYRSKSIDKKSVDQLTLKNNMDCYIND